MEQAIAELAIVALPIVLAITLHEAAHGYVARHFGDPTAWLAGRISLNPVRHIDPFGTILVPLLIYFSSAAVGGQGLLFGWAKPVPVDFSRLRRPKQDMLWVAAAGPFANILMALGWALIAKLNAVSPETGYSFALSKMALAGMQVNAVLMVLNLLPILPLDGGRIVESLAPHRLAYQLSRLEPYGFPILLLLLFTGVLNAILWPGVAWVMSVLALIFGLR
ncbi:MAG: hypothetical protein RIR70_140 [Pseudomonadota bacterium]|jgi:Zn-dependent protease